jgi:O-antigen ligase
MKRFRTTRFNRLSPPAATPTQAAVAPAPRKPSVLAVVLIWVMVVFFTIPSDIFTADKNAYYAVSSFSRSIRLILLTVSTAILLSRLAMAKQVMRHMNRYFTVFLILVPLSYFWSIRPSSTLARYVSVLSVFEVCLALFVAGTHSQQFQRVLRPIVTLILCGSLVFGMLAPDLAIEHGLDNSTRNAWHGLIVQKNAFGTFASFGVILWAHAWLARQVPAWQGLLFGGSSLACLILSRSTTSLFATVFAVIFLLLLMRSGPALRRYMPYLVGLFTATILTYAIAVLRLIPGVDLLFKPISLITGKDTTFSARSTIWEIIKEHIRYDSYFGSGYGAYWVGPDPTSPSYIFLSRMYFYPSESHNGYLEVANDLGYVGLCVLLGYMITFIRQSLQLMKVDRAQAALYLGLFFVQAIANLSESYWFQANSGFVYIFMTLTTVALARSLQLQSPQPQPAPRPRIPAPARRRAPFGLRRPA